MNKTLYPYYKNKLTKWFLTVTLLFSIFTFSGYSGNSQSKQLENIQTEIVVSNNLKTLKKTVSYKKGIELTAFVPLYNNFDKNWANALFTYNILTKVRLNTISSELYSHKPANHFLQVKTIPQNSDEDIFATFIG
jgi:hypothetical protein